MTEMKDKPPSRLIVAKFGTFVFEKLCSTSVKGTEEVWLKLDESLFYNKRDLS